jgi:hypothetical protein
MYQRNVVDKLKVVSIAFRAGFILQATFKMQEKEKNILILPLLNFAKCNFKLFVSYMLSCTSWNILKVGICLSLLDDR